MIIRLLVSRCARDTCAPLHLQARSVHLWANSRSTCWVAFDPACLPTRSTWLSLVAILMCLTGYSLKPKKIKHLDKKFSSRRHIQHAFHIYYVSIQHANINFLEAAWKIQSLWVHRQRVCCVLYVKTRSERLLLRGGCHLQQSLILY